MELTRFDISSNKVKRETVKLRGLKTDIAMIIISSFSFALCLIAAILDFGDDSNIGVVMVGFMLSNTLVMIGSSRSAIRKFESMWEYISDRYYNQLTATDKAVPATVEERCAKCGEREDHLFHIPSSACAECKDPESHHGYVPGDFWFTSYSIPRKEFLGGAE